MWIMTKILLFFVTKEKQGINLFIFSLLLISRPFLNQLSSSCQTEAGAKKPATDDVTVLSF